MKIKVRVPATSANCGPGFDCLGLALDLYNYFTFEANPKATAFTYSFSGLGADLLEAEDQKDNLVGQAMLRVFAAAKAEPVFGHLHSETCIPPARGLGSSSSAIVGGLLLANSYLGSPLSSAELLRIANDMEGHPDNVAPAIFGNIVCAVQQQGELKYTNIVLPEGLEFAVVVPEVIVSTEYARQALPKTLDYKQAVANVGYAALLVSSLMQGRLGNLKAALQDYLHVPYRKQLIPHCDEVFAAAEEAGALGATISGSGSTLIAYCNQNTRQVAEAMAQVFKDHGIEAAPYVLVGDYEGARII